MVMSYANRPGDAARAHQALAEVSRLRLLEVLRAYPKGLSAAEASAEVRLHQATTRQHLEMLVEAGLVVRTAEERTVRGRPRVIYRPSGHAKPGGSDSYRLLADILASVVETSVRRPSGAAEAAGVALGRSLVERPRSLECVPRREAEARLVELLGQLGFEPEPADGKEGKKILLHRCPFLDVATEHRAVVCSAHLGITKGVLAELGFPSTSTTLEPLVTPTLCITRLAS
jgi:predicted ArsR family transcriptional regulator